MVSDKLQNLYSERDKRKEILQNKPDTEWAKRELGKINAEIKQVEKEEIPKI